MSELILISNERVSNRWKLLSSVSAAALIVSAYVQAQAADVDRPLLWVELGGGLNALDNSQEAFLPPFTSTYGANGLRSPSSVEGPQGYDLETDGKLSFEPSGSDWVFAASIRYGRSGDNKESHQQFANAKQPVVPFTFYGFSFGGHSYYPTGHVKFADASEKQSESHVVLDFTAGKDVGLGMFGSQGSSVLSAGVRVAQFTSKTSINLHAGPGVHYHATPITNFSQKYAFLHSNPIHIYDYAAAMNAQRSFRGIGPSIAWNASLPFAGDIERGEFTVDWGADAAVLFGRQKVQGHHGTTTRGYYGKSWHGDQGVHDPQLHLGNFFGGPTGGGRGVALPTQSHSVSADFDRVHSVTVPNLGAVAGISYRFNDAKLSVGYRADFFFDAMDGGIDKRKSENVGFYGPFATLSIGIGG
jgi:hypothetical protein